MTGNIAIAKGALGNVPPVSLAFWRWLVVFLLVAPFVFREIYKKREHIIEELAQLFFLSFLG